MASTITFSGLGSGLEISDWVTALVEAKSSTTVTPIEDKISTVESQQSALSTLKTSYYSLRSAMQTLTDAKYGSAMDIFAKNTVTSSNSDSITATATASAARQNLSINVEQLATYTKAESASGTQVAGFADEDTQYSKLSNASAKTGTFSVYVDNEKFEFTIDDEDTMGDILSDISTQTGLNASIVDGKVSLSSDSGKKISVGSSSDTSNFVSVTGLNKNDDGSYSSYNAVSTVNTTAKLTGSDAGFATQIEEGSFKIGNAEFTINSTTTMQSLISKINSSSEAGVSAYWDATAGKMVLTSTQEGSFNINVENVSGNFTDVMGLTTSQYNEDGSVASSALADNSQTLGDVAKLTINGTSVISTSNTVTSDISGISGLTLNLKNATEGETVNIGIEQDTEQVVSAVQSFIEAYNTVIADTDTATDSDGVLHGESVLNTIRNSLRTGATTSTDANDIYKTLASIGITTGAIGTSTSENTNKLVFDEEAFREALSNDSDSVKSLLVGTGTDGKGILNSLEKTMSNALDATSGYFTTKEDSYDSRLSDLETSLEKANSALETYQTRLENQFNIMDQLISSMNSNLSYLNNALDSLSSS